MIIRRGHCSIFGVGGPLTNHQKRESLLIKLSCVSAINIMKAKATVSKRSLEQQVEQNTVVAVAGMLRFGASFFRTSKAVGAGLYKGTRTAIINHNNQ